MVDVARLGFEADTKDLVVADKRLETLEKQSMQTERATNQLAKSFDHMGASTSRAVVASNKMGKSMSGAFSGQTRARVQNTAFQLQDMAVQFEMGTDASRVFAQQLPQLLGGFGALGAVLGVVAGIGIPLVAMFLDSGEAASEAKDNIEDYEDAMKGLKSISKDLAVEQSKLAGTFRGMRIFDAEQQLRDLQTVYQELAKSGEGGAGLFTVLFGGKSERQEIFDQIRQINTALVDARKEQAELDKIEAFENLKEDARDLFETLSPLTKVTREYRENVALLEQAEREGALSTSKKVSAMALLTQQYNEQIDPLQNTIDALEEERELLQMSEKNRRVEIKLRKEVDDLRRAGVDVKQADIAFLREEIALNDQLAIKVKETKDAKKTALEEYVAQASNVNAQVEQATVRAFRGMEDALVDFVQTGKLDFRSLADSIIADLIRIQIRAQITSQIAGAFGGGGNIFGSLLSGITGMFTGGMTQGAGFVSDQSSTAPLFQGRASGGPVAAGRIYEVNERGPELLNVGTQQFLMMGRESGSVTPNHKIGQQAPSMNLKAQTQTSMPVVNVNIINKGQAVGVQSQTQSRNSSGGIDIDMMIDASVAKSVNERSSSTATAMRRNFGVSERLTSR